MRIAFAILTHLANRILFERIHGRYPRKNIIESCVWVLPNDAVGGKGDATKKETEPHDICIEAHWEKWV